MSKNTDIIECANNIKEFCISHTTNEEECPFFRGYRKENGVNIVVCELNKGNCSPSNWNIN